MARERHARMQHSGPEADLERRRRIERLRQTVLAGRYFVPAAEVARSVVRRLGIDGLLLQHQ